MSIGGVGFLSTIIAVPVVLGLEVATLAYRLLGVAGKFVSRCLVIKAKKHDELCLLAEAKLNAISDHVSTLLQVDHISDEEFRLIVEEVEKYNQMKGLRAEQRQGVIHESQPAVRLPASL